MLVLTIYHLGFINVSSFGALTWHSLTTVHELSCPKAPLWLVA